MGSQYDLPVRQNYTYQISTKQTPRDSITFTLTDAGDISLGESGRSLTFITGLEKIRQDIQVIIKSGLGSCEIAPELGVDMFAIIDSEYDPQVIESEFRSAILKHPDINYLDNFEVKRSSDLATESEYFRHHYFVEFFAVTMNNEKIFCSVSL